MSLDAKMLRNTYFSLGRILRAFFFFSFMFYFFIMLLADECCLIILFVKNEEYCLF